MKGEGENNARLKEVMLSGNGLTKLNENHRNQINLEEEIDRNMKGKFKLLGHIGLALFLVSALVLALAPVAQAATAVTEVWVEFPYTTSSNEADDTDGSNVYLVHLKPTTALSRGVDTVTVTWPDGSATLCGTASSDRDFTVGTLEYNDVQWSTDYDTSLVTTASWTYSRGNPTSGGYRVQATAPIDVAAGADVWLKFDVDGDDELEADDAGSSYKVYVQTSQDTTPVLSSAFTLGSAVCTALTTSISPSSAGAASQYTFTFEPETTLSSDTGTVTVKFPVGTVLPSSISASNVQFNDGSTGYTATGSTPVVDQDRRTVTATASLELADDGSSKYMRILAGAGITNPAISSANDYYCMILTSSDGQWFTASAAHEVTAGTATKVLVCNGEIGQTSTRYSDDATMINFYSDAIYVALADDNGNVKAPASSVTVTLSSSSATGGFFWVDTDADGTGAMVACSTVAVSVADPGVTSGDYEGDQIVYYKDSTAGTHTLTFTASDYTTATWTITVAPAVSLYDSNNNLVSTFAPTTSAPASETSSSTCSAVSNEQSADYITDAITAAMTDDTIKLGDGTYESDTNGLTVDEAITLTSVNGADYTTIRISEDSTQMLLKLTSRATISGLHLKGWLPGETPDYDDTTFAVCFSANGTAANYGYVKNCKMEGFYDGIATWGGGARSYWKIQNNEFDNCRTGVYCSENSSTYWTIDGNTFTNYFAGIGGTASNTYFTIKNNSISGIDSSCQDVILDLAAAYGCEGIGLSNSSSTNVVTKNTITNNDYGIKLYAAAANTKVKYNDISGNNSFGIYDEGGYGASTTAYNWWGDVTGPSAGTGSYASTALGSGDPVATGITYEPWLHKQYADVVADNASYQACDITLVQGWNTLSTPVKLISSADSINELIPSGMTIGYYYDATGWHQITTGYVLNPCDAVYVKMSPEATYVYLKFDAGAWTMPSKDLDAGWNLIGLAYIDSSGKQVDYAVASVYRTADNLPGYAQVIAPSLIDAQTDMYGTAHASWSYSSGGSASGKEMFAGLGYWIYMQNAATLAGFTITPIVPDFD
jgi:parallel beta-helix repeat protein